jgi:Ca2+-binding EF-hand superfamily protein
MKEQGDEQLKELFDKLDENKNGFIEFEELKNYFSTLNQQNSSVTIGEKNQAREFFENFGASFTFRDFVDYVNKRDTNMAIIFRDLDKNK